MDLLGTIVDWKQKSGRRQGNWKTLALLQQLSELSSPRILPCLHSVCANCSPCCSSSANSSGSPDPLAEFLIETAHETTEMCANCEQTKQPMYFCETCQQALCHECKAITHQARMFASHRIVIAEESARVRGRLACAQHSEPYILYCTDRKCLACIQCFNDRPPDDRFVIYAYSL
ncbi:unnamed protein product [Strongylus vulgaris]|uniref:B box-type domain-containing protein n=1 Tax=Strongylus vulgaris TaxID=40348 RepID=A0A3P7J952_STRVU|nr:unnamed protein product [Strongylus vulgaris]